MARYDYNVIVIGGGSAGLVSSLIAAAVKAKVALIEKHKMGGDCLNTGCVPSKALIRSAKIASYAKRAQDFGFTKIDVSFDFEDIMARVHQAIKTIEPHDSPERYTGLGVDCIAGEGRIISPHEVEVDGRILSARKIIVATGARPLVPNIAGLGEVDYLTSDNLWELKKLPKKLVVLGGGPIGAEMAQAFARLGSDVSIVEMAPHILPREDDDVIAFAEEKFAAEKIKLFTGHTAQRFEKGKLICTQGGEEVTLPFDQVILALGRRANVTGFGLEELGVNITKGGTVEANPFLQTSVPSIYVCGDVTGPYQFTHTASHQAWYAAVNALFSPLKKFKVDYRVIPWATFTDPEIARVGLNEKDARAQNIAYEIATYDMKGLDRAIADSEAHGFIKVLVAPGKDKILGATIVGPQAGDLIAEYVLAMKHGLGLNKILGTIHAYPTLMEANKAVAGEWRRANAPEWALNILEKFHRWRR